LLLLLLVWAFVTLKLLMDSIHADDLRKSEVCVWSDLWFLIAWVSLVHQIVMETQSLV
jgi:hypothetical protein